MIAAVTTLLGTVFTGLIDHFKNKQAINKAVTENKIRLAQSEQTHNQAWEMKQLDNAGWKDDILFYSFIACFVWAGFDPEGASVFFSNLSVLPEWFLKTWFWLIASVLGVKKIGDYMPVIIDSVRSLTKGGSS